MIRRWPEHDSPIIFTCSFSDLLSVLIFLPPSSSVTLPWILGLLSIPLPVSPPSARDRLAKVIPGLRPWEVLSVEQAMDMITYNGEWFREPLGSYATGPPYIIEWNRDVTRMLNIFRKLSIAVCNKMERTIPGFDKVMDKLRADGAVMEERMKEVREARKKALAEAAMKRSIYRF